MTKKVISLFSGAGGFDIGMAVLANAIGIEVFRQFFD